MFRGVPLLFVAMPSVVLGWELRLPLPLEILVCAAGLAVSFLLVVSFEVNARRDRQRAMPRLAIAFEVILTFPAWAGSLCLIEAAAVEVGPHLPDPSTIAYFWAFVLGVAFIEFGFLGLVSWLIIVIARRATAYIVPAPPPVA
jgi:hypothetical protein